MELIKTHKKKNYKDFIGTTICRELKVWELFAYRTYYDLLRSELYAQIKKELGWTNGLLCDFSDASFTLDDNNKTVKISATVIKCEVDC